MWAGVSKMFPAVSFWPVVLWIWSSAVKSRNFGSHATTCVKNCFILQAHNWNVYKTVSECLKTTFKFTKYFVDSFLNFVIWSGHCFFCVYLHPSKQCVSLGVLWMHICVLLHVIYINIWIYSVYLTCHLTSWFAIYTGLGTFFYFKMLPPDLHVLYWCTVWP